MTTVTTMSIDPTNPALSKQMSVENISGLKEVFEIKKPTKKQQKANEAAAKKQQKANEAAAKKQQKADEAAAKKQQKATEIAQKKVIKELKAKQKKIRLAAEKEEKKQARIEARTVARRALIQARLETARANAAARRAERIADLRAARTAAHRVDIQRNEQLRRLDYVIRQSTTDLRNESRTQEQLTCATTAFQTDECPICLEDLGETNCMVLRCGHKTCGDCILRHFQTVGGRKCPVCRDQYAVRIKGWLAPIPS